MKYPESKVGKAVAAVHFYTLMIKLFAIAEGFSVCSWNYCFERDSLSSNKCLG